MRAAKLGITGPGRELAAVKRELEEWQDFVEKWLQEVEEPAPMTSDQQQLRARLEAVVGTLRGPQMQLSDEGVTSVLKDNVLTWHGQFRNLRLEQVESIVAEVISSL